MSQEPSSGESDGIFKCQEGFVYQIPTLPMMHEGINPIAGSIYTDTLMATQNGATAKNAFVFNSGKHPSRNIFSFFRRDIGDIIFDIDEWDQESISVISTQEWMERNEEDAMAEIQARADDPTTEVEELIIETLLGISS